MKKKIDKNAIINYYLVGPFDNVQGRELFCKACVYSFKAENKNVGINLGIMHDFVTFTITLKGIHLEGMYIVKVHNSVENYSFGRHVYSQ